MTTTVIFLLMAIVTGLAHANGPPLGAEKFGLFHEQKESYLQLTVESLGKPALIGQLGVSLAEALGQPTETCEPGESDECFEWADFARLYMTAANKETNDNCATIEWYSPFARRLEDCFELEAGVHWYGGGGPKYTDVWPIEVLPLQESAMVPGSGPYGGVTENYWLTSSGVAIHVHDETALFFSLNSTRPNKACLVAQDKFPYKERGEVRLKYDLCVGDVGENFKQIHQRAIRKYYPLPTGTPDEDMILKPFWSTWAEYKMDVNESLVLQLAEDLVTQGFAASSHVEIDDNWESCYGQYEFDPVKFSDPAGLTAQLKQLGFRTTLWAHPFINIECPAYKEAIEHGYLVKDDKGVAGMTRWWQGNNAGTIDFTNDAAVQWWSGRLRRLQTEYGIDSFKFDAGESNMLPANHNFPGHTTTTPNYYTTKYIQAAAEFGGLIEVRAARQNQDLPIFVRMLDKDSRWGYDNGLQSIIPTLFDFGIKSYPFVLPDMIGGNAYGDGWIGDKPEKQLYIRWMQLNSFMPAFQFSVLPWNYDEETMDIVKGVLAIRDEFKDKILQAAQQAVIDGSPINRPMWWVDPEDANTLTIDDQYMLGDDILVSPIVRENATRRDIYLPQGRWTIRLDSTNNVTYDGPLLLTDFDVPLNFLPFFIRESNA